MHGTRFRLLQQNHIISKPITNHHNPMLDSMLLCFNDVQNLSGEKPYTSSRLTSESEWFSIHQATARLAD